MQHYEPMIDDATIDSWGNDGVQALERVRATGRLAVQKMTQVGRTYINNTDVCEAYEQVERISATTICGRD